MALVAPAEAVAVVERLELIEVDVGEGERLVVVDQALDLAGDLAVARQAGQGRHVLSCWARRSAARTRATSSGGSNGFAM